jgi:hypothetical protein
LLYKKIWGGGGVIFPHGNVYSPRNISLCAVLYYSSFFIVKVSRLYPPPELFCFLAENLWLKGLRNDLNAETIEEVYRMADKKLTLDEVPEKIGLTAEWEKRGEARGEKNAWQKAIGLLKQGYTPEQLEQMSPGSPAGPAS